MDSLTQLALGAAVGEATLGRKVGNRAILWGAIAGTLPDLDVFIPLGDVVRDFTYHRSASHSIFVLALLTPLLVWLITRIHPRTADLRRQWAMTIYLVFLTHVLLDSLTAYGTQIFWPLVNTPVSWSTIFIIDPAYTLPLIAGVLAALILSRDSDRGHLINRFGLALSSLYLGWTLVAKTIVERNFEQSLAAQGIEYERLFTTPAPFNSLLWRAVARSDSAYYEGYYSVFDRAQPVQFTRYPSEDGLLSGLEDYWPANRLKWFSRGFYAVNRDQQDIIISDLRMGGEPHYVFRFKVAEVSNPHPRPVAPEQLKAVRDWSQLKSIWQRIWIPDVSLQPG